MENPETQAILATKHRTKTYKTKNGESRHRQYWAKDTERRHTKQRMENPETQAILATKHRTKTYKTKTQHIKLTK
jgi:hypothetical protein